MLGRLLLRILIAWGVNIVALLVVDWIFDSVEIGRWGSVSDVDFIARTHVMNKTQVSLIFGSIVAAHTWRIARDPRYDHFFVHPTAEGLRLGWSLER